MRLAATGLRRQLEKGARLRLDAVQTGKRLNWSWRVPEACQPKSWSRSQCKLVPSRFSTPMHSPGQPRPLGICEYRARHGLNAFIPLSLERVRKWKIRAAPFHRPAGLLRHPVATIHDKLSSRATPASRVFEIWSRSPSVSDQSLVSSGSEKAAASPLSQGGRARFYQKSGGERARLLSGGGWQRRTWTTGRGFRHEHR